METVSQQWVQALPHRSGEQLVAAVERLVAVGLGPQEVRVVLADLGDGMWGRLNDDQQGSAGGDEEGVRRALLLVELGAFIGYAQERAAAARRAAYSALLQDYSVVRLAQVLGVSRQAVHKTVSAENSRREFAARLTGYKGESDV